MGQALRFFLKNDSIPDPDELVRECWTSSPYSLGTYCTPGLGSSVNTFDRIAAPLPSEENPRLLFAGEATSTKQWSFAHGAMSTGILAAQKVIDLLNLWHIWSGLQYSMQLSLLKVTFASWVSSDFSELISFLTWDSFYLFLPSLPVQ